MYRAEQPNNWVLMRKKKKNKDKDFGLINLIDSICRCADSPSYADQTSMAKSLLALMTSPTCGVHEAAMLKAVRAVFHVFLVTKSPPAKDVCKAVLLDMLKSVFTRMEAYDAVLHNENSWDDDTNSVVSSMGSVGNWEGRPENSHDNRNSFASQFHTDGYLLFRALCKLSAKPLKEDTDGSSSTGTSTTKITLFTATSSSDPLASKSKTLALELILSVFNHCGPAFRKGEKFLYAVQNYLCESLLKNCMSNNTGVVHLSLKIFLRLVYKFKAHLKAEIEVFVANIFLPVLESPNSPFEQKRLVLDALRSLCSDPVTLTQIFLNYDCDFDAVNLFRIIVHNLTALSVRSRNNLNPGSKNETQVLALSMAGLEVLVVTVRAFLKALNLPGGDDNFDTEDSAFAKIRGNLQLDVGMAAKSDDESFLKSMAGYSQSEVDVSSKDIEIMQSSESMQLANPSHNGVSTEDVAEKIFNAFDRKQMVQQNLEMGVVKFSLSFKQGLLFFIERGFFNLDAKEIAVFFHDHKEKLDMTMIGEVLGKEPEASFVKDKGVDSEKGGIGFYVRILHHFVDYMEFSGLEFDNAIRLFLSGFRLPGEAQKIDRVMEKFAERYTRKNEDIFPSADTAFILAFSVIMLQTDLHNPSIKPEKKMTIDGFIRQNRGISVDGGDLPEDLLTGIYKRIQTHPFTLKEDDDARAATTDSNHIGSPAFFGSSEDRRRERFRKERAELMAASEILFKKKSAPEKSSSSAQSELAESVCPADVVKPMFDVTWGPLLGTLSQVLEMAEDDSSIALALNGFVYCVRISAHTGMALARNTFILSLTQFTTLGFVKEMKRKNIECIRTLLSIAIMDGEHLGESWQPVLQCISQLGRLQLFASGVAPDDFGEGKKQKLTEDSSSFFRLTPKVEMARETEENNGRAVLEAINEVLIEKVFSSSVNLSPVSIVHFVDCLVAVSETEIVGDSKKGISGVGRLNASDVPSGGTNGTPRTFSLQRLVEVADCNMDKRPRLIWGDIWNLMAKHFVKIGCHENSKVSMFAIDALRQLSCKFLEKPELEDFNFQRLFLQPFLSIMQSPHPGTRELVLQCVDNILRNATHNLKSGWKIFFSILAVSGSDPSEKISTFGMAILQRLLDDHLDDLSRLKRYDGHDIDDETNMDGTDKQKNSSERKARNANAEDFIGLCRASLAFVERENQLPIGLSLRALCHASIYADLIASGRVLPPVSGAQSSDRLAFGYTYAGLEGKEAEEMVLWRPILDGLANGMCSTVQSKSGGVGCVLQRGSVMTLRAILLCHGQHFSAKQWAIILDQTILPAMQKAAENDSSPVTGIISESPTVSNLDFLVDPLPLPPSPDDEGLKKFALAAQSDESAPTRSLGESELLVEASFADLRHGGDGNLTKAHDLLKKDAGGDNTNIEQPFPDSWVATTAPIALGMLTDLFIEKIVNYGLEGRRFIWPMIIAQMQQWTIGEPIGKGQSQVRKISVEMMEATVWKPCEALVRIGCKEISRLTQTLVDSLPRLNAMEGKAWLNTHCLNLADTISKNLEMETILHTELVRAKTRLDSVSKCTEEEGTKSDEKYRVSTLYGEGSIVGKRVDKYKDDLRSLVNINVVKLDSGAIMYGPTYETGSAHISTESSPSSALTLVTKRQDPSEEKDTNSKFLLRQFIRPLKLRCIASYCLQRILSIIFEDFACKTGKREVTILLRALEKSRAFACKASLDKELSVLFKQATNLEWGDDISTFAAGYLSPGGARYRGSSEMFFLTQEAGANKAIVTFLSLLCRSGDQGGNHAWDTARFAEPLLLDRMTDVLQKFIFSEIAVGEHIDPNVWRMHSESGGKIAVYCTSFAAVVVMILSTILGSSVDRFERQKDKIFPYLCALVRVQSEEIRKLVADVFSEKVGVLLGVEKS
mmetsp:Transcript_31336/g.37283  ORF Transcript_31336/g.37283 Transcript_31336/m.37283 type:complete len:1900 (-) Transcript_31336:92-5791(-)